MKDCRLTITVRNDDIRCEMENISMVELATLSGYLQMLVGQERSREVWTLKRSRQTSSMSTLIHDQP